MANADIRLGDVIRTEIKCAGGELISIVLDTTLPRLYSRKFTVRGTKAGYWGDNDMLIEDKNEEQQKYHWKPRELWGNAEEYEEQYQHPLWKKYPAHGGHGGLDWLVCRAFVDAIKHEVQTPIDVYDTASWMCISALSEQSIAMGGAPQAIPDFTNGRWVNRLDVVDQEFGLNKV